DVYKRQLVPYMRNLQKRNTTFTVTWRLISVARAGNRLTATIGTDYSGFTRTQSHDQIVVNHGTEPNAGLYFDLKPLSRNLGAVDYDALIAGRPQGLEGGPGRFRLYRIGDAVESRNTHAAIYDALRLVKDI
ncbi:MAG: N-methylproline demethylase, partial [Anaerolineae bacterium]|nr:N-methylproline demethylase [Anaerolineae bacterium]